MRVTAIRSVSGTWHVAHRHPTPALDGRPIEDDEWLADCLRVVKVSHAKDNLDVAGFRPLLVGWPYDHHRARLDELGIAENDYKHPQYREVRDEADRLHRKLLRASPLHPYGKGPCVECRWG